MISTNIHEYTWYIGIYIYSYTSCHIDISHIYHIYIHISDHFYAGHQLSSAYSKPLLRLITLQCHGWQWLSVRILSWAQALRPPWGYHHDLPETSMEPPCSPNI